MFKFQHNVIIKNKNKEKHETTIVLVDKSGKHLAFDKYLSSVDITQVAFYIDTDIFQFQGDGLEAYKLQINKDLMEAMGKALGNFKGTLSDFIEDESYGNRCMHELLIESKVFANNLKN